MSSISKTHQDERIDKINAIAKKITGCTSPFFKPCTLQYSNSNCPEAQFLRRILYCYSLFCECGQKAIRFCIAQSQFSSIFRSDPEAEIKNIHALRTISAHSTQGSSNKLTKITQSWFRKNIQSCNPETSDHWEICSNAIDSIFNNFILSITLFLESIRHDPEMKSMRDELKSRIDEGLCREEVEEITARVLTEQTRFDLSPGLVTDRYIASWTSQLKIKSSRINFKLESEKIIEETIATIPRPLPFSGGDLMMHFQLEGGPIIGHLIRIQRSMVDEGILDSGEILASLREAIDKFQSP